MREFIDKSTVNISKTIGGQNDFADCIRDSVKAVIDNSNTVTEQEIVKPYLDRLKKEIDRYTDMHADGEFYIKNYDVKRMIDTILSKLSEQEEK